MQVSPGKALAVVRRAIVLPAFILAVGLQLGPARAQDISQDPSFLSIGVGAYDVFEGLDRAADFRLEYRHGDGLWIFKPWAGIEATSDGALYGVIGFLTDFYFGRRIVVTPSVGIGAYHDGDGLELGNTFEIRSQLEIAYRFDDRSRLGLAMSHISNAGTGNKNPGTEIITVYYSLPLGELFPSMAADSKNN